MLHQSHAATISSLGTVKSDLCHQAGRSAVTSTTITISITEQGHGDVLEPPGGFWGPQMFIHLEQGGKMAHMPCRPGPIRLSEQAFVTTGTVGAMDRTVKAGRREGSFFWGVTV